MQGGKVVTLFNVKQEAYLSGHGSFVNDILPDFLKSSKESQGKNKGFMNAIATCLVFTYLTFFLVGYRKRKLIKGVVHISPDSGDTYFQLETVDNPLSGNVLLQCIHNTLHVLIHAWKRPYWVEILHVVDLNRLIYG